MSLNKDISSDVQNIYRLRKLLKLSSTFVEPYLGSEVIHSQFHTLKSENALFGTSTGRFSSSHPNLQNIPSRENEFRKEIRGFFEPDKDCEWFSFDYSQIEYRLVANFGKGKNGEELRNQYMNDVTTDFHKTVMKWTGLPRKEAKVANFLLVYGGWYLGLQKQLRCSEEEAKEIYNLYHLTFPTIKHTFFYYQKKARLNKGEVRTIWNRRRILRPGEERKALNTFIQGSAADIMKEAMLCLQSKNIYDTIGYPLLTVHDELAFSIPNSSEKKEVVSEIKETMENVGVTNGLMVPLLINIEKGNSWGDLEEVLE